MPAVICFRCCARHALIIAFGAMLPAADTLLRHGCLMPCFCLLCRYAMVYADAASFDALPMLTFSPYADAAMPIFSMHAADTLIIADEAI